MVERNIGVNGFCAGFVELGDFGNLDKEVYGGIWFCNQHGDQKGVGGVSESTFRLRLRRVGDQTVGLRVTKSVLMGGRKL